MQNRLERLLARAREISVSPGATRRRDELIEEASAAGLSYEFASFVYDVATDTQLDPGLAFALVLSGVGVRELAVTPPDGWQETQVEAPPAWVNPDDTRADEAGRERQLRTTFRRLHSLLDTQPTVEAALEAFVREPDVDDVVYRES